MNHEVKAVLLKLAKVGIRFKLNGDKVKLEGDLSTLDGETKAFMKANKAAIVDFIQSQQQTRAPFNVQKAPQGEPLPASFAQQRLWFIDTLEAQSAQYNLPMTFCMEGPFDRSAFEKTIDTLVSRHQVLGERLVQTGNGLTQVYDPNLKVAINWQDLGDNTLEALAEQDANTAFDLSKPPFFRVTVVKVHEQCHGILFNLHHLVTDGWSEQIMSREFIHCYNQYAQGQTPTLTPLEYQYRDYAWSQRQWLQGEVLEQQLAYWHERLAGLPPVHHLPLDVATRPKEQTFNGETFSHKLGGALSQSLSTLAREQDVTLFMLLQTAFALWISRVSGETDVAMGTPLSGRNHQAVEGLMGCFVNTLVLRNRL